jgi:pilus assembly protein CpaE
LGRIRVALVDDEPELLARVSAMLGQEPDIERVGTGRNGREALQIANRLRPDVMVLDVNMPLVNGIQAAARITSLVPSVGLIILTLTESTVLVKQAFKAGAKDFLNKATDLPELARVVREVDARRDRNRPARALASVWSFYATKGNSGCTTLAVNTAFDLASLGYRVLLVDLDLVSGDCAFHLNLPPPAPGKNLFTNLPQLGDLTEDSVRPYVRRYQAPGLAHVPLAVIESPCTLTPGDPATGDRVAALLDLVVTLFDHVVVDLPPGLIRDRAVIAAMDISERVFAVFNREMSALRTMAPFIAALSRGHFRMDRLSLLIGNLVRQVGFDHRAWLEPRMPGLTKMGLEQVLDVPLDVDSCGMALSRGVPVLAENAEGSLARFIHEIVERSLTHAPAAAERGELWGTLRAVLGR